MRTRRSQFSGNPMQSMHRSVLLHEATEFLAIQPDDCVVDATLGGAGHALAIAGKLGKGGTLIGIDADHDAIERSRKILESFFAPPSPKATRGHGKATKGARMILIQANFRDLSAEFGKLGIAEVDKILFDLGWSSFQLDAGRGFSLKSDEPLLMTYSSEGGSASGGKKPGALTAQTIVNEWAEESIADVIFGWGGERYSRRIARCIVERRATKPFATARELAEAIYAAVPPRYRYGRIHPATRTFQALRIAVNDELGALAQGLAGGWRMLSTGGRIAVITFHSIEDRLVKQTFKQWEEEGEGKRITRKPVAPSPEELKNNPRARSAKLRVIEKVVHRT